jgi:hypothetical protein
MSITWTATTTAQQKKEYLPRHNHHRRLPRMFASLPARALDSKAIVVYHD